MDNEYFGFTESPFNVTSDPRFLGIKLRQGLIVMTGEAGTGKTTLLRMVTEKFEPTIHTALILGHCPDFSALLRLMLVDFGLPNPPDDRLTMLQELRSYLTERLQKNHIASALFDEAQDMDVADA